MTAHRLTFSCSIVGVVLAQLVLAVIQGRDDRVDLALARLVLAEVVLEPVAERDDAEQLVGREQVALLLRVEVLDRAAQLTREIDTSEACRRPPPASPRAACRGAGWTPRPRLDVVVPSLLMSLVLSGSWLWVSS